MATLHCLLHVKGIISTSDAVALQTRWHGAILLKEGSILHSWVVRSGSNSVRVTTGEI
jgi:hypothetical protein